MNKPSECMLEKLKWFPCGSEMLHIRRDVIDKKQSSTDSEIEFNFETDDIESVHRHMRSNGVEAGERYGQMIWRAK